MSHCLTGQATRHLCGGMLLASLVLPSAAAQSLGGKAPIPQQTEPPERVDLPAGSACSAFGLKNDSEAALVCFRTSQASISGKWEKPGSWQLN